MMGLDDDHSIMEEQPVYAKWLKHDSLHININK